MIYNVRTHKVKGIAIYFLFLPVLWSCSGHSTDTDVYRTVRLTMPESASTTNSEGYAGIIEEGKSVNAAFMADGKIDKLYVKEGDRVKKGQLLASVEDKDYQIGVKQLTTQFTQMTEEKKRMDEMFSRHNIAPNDYEKFSAGYEQLHLQLQMAENKLGYTKLYSPADGYVAEKYMEPGELIGAGTPVFKISDDTKLVVGVDMPVNVYLNRNNITSASGFVPAFPNEAIPLSIESFTPDPSNNMLYRLKLDIPSKYAGALSPGMNIRVEITTKDDKNEGIIVQSRSVFDMEGSKYVWVYNSEDSTIHKKHVKVIDAPLGNKLKISGLNGDEQIIETGVKQLYEGEKVIVSKNSDYVL